MPSKENQLLGTQALIQNRLERLCSTLKGAQLQPVTPERSVQASFSSFDVLRVEGMTIPANLRSERASAPICFCQTLVKVDKLCIARVIEQAAPNVLRRPAGAYSLENVCRLVSVGPCKGGHHTSTSMKYPSRLLPEARTQNSPHWAVDLPKFLFFGGVASNHKVS